MIDVNSQSWASLVRSTFQRGKLLEKAKRFSTESSLMRAISKIAGKMTWRHLSLHNLLDQNLTQDLSPTTVIYIRGIILNDFSYVSTNPPH